MDAKTQEKELLAPKIAASVSVCLAIFKLIMGVKISSLALVTSGLDSSFDALMSTASFFFLKISHRPADEDHPYGHSRVASVTSLAQGVVLLFVTTFLVYSAAQKIDHPPQNNYGHDYLLVAVIAMITTLGLSIYLKKIVQQTGSQVVAADRFHYLTDFGANFLLLAGYFIGPKLGKYSVDSLLTFALCVFIITGAYKIVMDSINNLVDRHDPYVERIVIEIVKKLYPKVLGAQRIRSRKSGHLTAIDLEVVSCRIKSFEEVHETIHKVENAILAELPYVDILIHPEPCTAVGCAGGTNCLAKHYELARGPKTD